MCTETLGISELIAAANKNDRLKLLDDPCVLAGNLDNAIHSLFTWFIDYSIHMRQALQLASLFIESDSLLEFFIPLTYGQQKFDTKTDQTFLTNPLAWKSDAEIKIYITGIREALECLGHCVTFRWGTGKQRLWGRTLLVQNKSHHTSTCSNAFDYKNSVLVELNDKFRAFYADEENGYSSSTVTRCDQFRHDFQFATTLIHEIVHAYGVMRRSSLAEPFIRLDYPSDSAEWGYAWENFMFGAIINPQTRKKLGTHVQLRKTWASTKKAIKFGGKEYSAVPVSWTAQWFRKETWGKIKKDGPLAVPQSVTRVKFVLSSKLNQWVILTDVPDIQKDFKSRQVLCTLVNSDLLQKSNVPIPLRVPQRILSSNVSRKAVSRDLVCKTSLTTARAAVAELAPLSPVNSGTKRKRSKAIDSARPRKTIKV